MGASLLGSAVSTAEGLLRQAESGLASAKDQKKQAIANGNYKNASQSLKTRTSEGKVLNHYDYEIYRYQKLVKERKAQLADAKKREKAAKKK